MSWYFEAGRHGWTESHWFPGTNLAAAMLGGLNAAPLRAALLGVGVVLKGVGARDEFSRKAAIYTTIVQNQSDSTLRRDTPWNGLYCRFYDPTFTYFRNVIFRGLPDDFVLYNKGGGETIPPALNAPLRALFNNLANGGFAFQTRVKNNANPALPVTGLGVDPLGRVTVSVPGHAYVEGQQVRVSQVRGENLRQKRGGAGINGLWPITNPGPGVFSLPLLASTLTGPLRWVEKGITRPVVFVDPPPPYRNGSFSIVRYDRFKTGRVTGVSKGRQRSRESLR